MAVDVVPEPIEPTEPTRPTGWVPSDRVDAERVAVAHLGELWRIEHSLSTVRAEVTELAALDDAVLRARLATMVRCWRSELQAVLPVPLAEELCMLLGWSGDEAAGATELRLGLAQLEGWLDGLLAGIPFTGVEPPPS